MRSCPLALAAGVPVAFGRDRRDRRGAARPGSRGAARQRRGRLDEGIAAALPAPVELGQRLHRDRLGAPGRPARDDRARAAVRGAVVDRHGPAHRVPGRSGRGLLSRPRVVGLRRRHPGCARAPGADDRDLPAAGARAGGAADLAADAAAAAAGDPRAHPGAVPAAGALAPLPGHRARPRGIGAGHHLPSVGGHGQLTALGPGARAHQGSQARPVHPPRHQRAGTTHRSGPPTGTTTGTCGWSSCCGSTGTTTCRSTDTTRS